MFIPLFSHFDYFVQFDVLFEHHQEEYSLIYSNNFLDQVLYVDMDYLSFQERYFDDVYMDI